LTEPDPTAPTPSEEPAPPRQDDASGTTPPAADEGAAEADAGLDLPAESRTGERPSGGGEALYTAREAPSPETTATGPAAAREVDHRILRNAPFLDDHYNETYLFLVPRDAESLFALWEVGESTRLQLIERFGEDFFETNRLILRIAQVTGVEYDGSNANHVFEIDDDLHWKNNYWARVHDGEEYVAEIGYRAEGTTFFEQVARSNRVAVPQAGLQQTERYADWAAVSVDPNSVEVPVQPEGWRFNQYRYWRERTHDAPEEKGYWSLVLHQHLPFVRHPEWEVSLEEQWFFEAVLSVYTQILHLFWVLERDKVDFRLTVSMTPPLISMLQDPLLQERASRHIDECIALARRERDNAGGKPWRDAVEQTLHRFWVAREVFQAYEGDLTRGYRDFQDLGKVEVITCPATHMLLPMFQHMPEAVRAQLRLACRQYERVFGRRPRGCWLPENAFTPGLDRFLAEEGIAWFLVSARSFLSGDTRAFYGTNAPAVTPHGVACFGIDEKTRDQVWSREAGYPGHEHYKEWYRDLGYDADWDYLPDYFKTANVRRNTGIKYYRITGKDADLSEKDYYNVAWAEQVAHEQAGQFVFYRGAQANHALESYGRKPCVVSAYDAELFGHWWEEGPLWLESVCRKLLYDQAEVRPVTPSEYLDEHRLQQRMMPGAGSWGKKDYFGTWVDGREYQPNCWVYRHYYRLCARLCDLATEHRETSDESVIRALNQAAREFCLAVSSDWGFLIETGQAAAYSEQRIVAHLDRAKELMRQVRAGAVDGPYLRTLEAADTLLPVPDMDFRVFARGDEPA
jgi:1,4-alpha-glucan branching enzyme